MNRRLVAAVCPCVLLCGIVGNLRAEITAEQVRTAIDRGVGYLKNQQHDDGSWSELTGFSGGVTSLCTLALLNAGVPPDDESIQKSLHYLRRIDPEMTYVVSLQTMVFARADPSRNLSLLRKNVAWLQKTQITKGPAAGSWTYGLIDAGGDNSNTQFALLALYEAERVGVPAADETWRAAKNTGPVAKTPTVRGAIAPRTEPAGEA